MRHRILILAALAAVAAACGGPSLEGRWQDDTPTGTGDQMALVYDFAEDGSFRLFVNATESSEAIGDFTISMTVPGTYTFDKDTITMAFDKEKGECKVDLEPSSLLGLLGDMAIDGMKDEMARNYMQGMAGTLVFTDVKLTKDKFTYNESGKPGSAFRLTGSD